MPYELKHRLVIGIASSALFDLTESNQVFVQQGEEPYREYQEKHLDECLEPGTAYPFIRRLLSLNNLNPGDPPVEVIVLSKNDPDTGLRVMRSIQTLGLPITRAIFMQGRSPFRFVQPLNMSLFLSADERDVREAVQRGLPAGLVIDGSYVDDAEDVDLRIAFDFDGVLSNDSAERVHREHGLDEFRQHELTHADTPLDRGPLRDLLANINRIQQMEQEKRRSDGDYQIRVHVALVTARNAPAHERALMSLKSWGVTVNDAFFLGGIDKSAITQELRPHIFFDDQRLHLNRTSISAPSVHIPFGVANEPPSTGEG